MCDICDNARAARPLKKALDIVAHAMQQRANRGRDCLDKLVGELVGESGKGQDALDCETEPLKERP